MRSHAYLLYAAEEKMMIYYFILCQHLRCLTLLISEMKDEGDISYYYFQGRRDTHADYALPPPVLYISRLY